MEAVGKNLFAFFGSADGKDGNSDEEEEEVVVHVHFGMSGVWAVYNSKLEEPEVKPTTRLRLQEVASNANGRSSTSNGNNFITHLSAMTVAHGNHSLFSSKKAALGQDPLRTDADPELLYNKIAKSKKSIGKIIMDQSYFAGPGNIYRAEILFLAGVYPTTLGTALDRSSFDRIWNVSVNLLRKGYDTGSILTVDSVVDPRVAARGERRYIYNKAKCARCGGRVSSWDMAGRTCYACEGGSCQPKVKVESSIIAGSGGDKAVVKKEVKKKGKVTVVEGKKSKKQPKQHVPFISHCAPINFRQRLEQGGAEQLTIAEIRSVMEQMVGSNNANDLPPKSARKAVQVEALNIMLLEEQQHQPKVERAVKEDENATTTVTTTSAPSNIPLPPPLVSSEDAAREKAISGENRAVEHVAELSREQAVKAIVSLTPSPVASGDGKQLLKKRAKRVGKRRGGTETETESVNDGTMKVRSRRRLKYDA